MSLVNDMLKDLDKRQAPDQNPAPAAAGYGSLTREGSNSTVIIAVLLLVCVLLVAGAVSVWLFKDQLLAIIDGKKTEPSTVSTVEDSPMTSEVDVPILATEKVSIANEPPVEEKVLENLGSPKAVVVNETAEEKTSEEKAVNDMSGASGKVVDADPVDIRGVEKVKVEMVKAETIKVEKARENKPKNTAVEKNRPEIAQAPTKEKTDIVKPATSIKAQVVKTKVVKTPEQTDGEVVAKASEYLRAGNKAEAVSLLRQHISTASLHDRSSEMLVMVFSQSRQFEEANQLIERFPVSHASLAMQLKARVLLAQGNTAEAITVLEQKLPELSEYPDHHVMLAAFYQQSGRYNEAASVYASLIAHDESEGNWWAGLGIALEGSNQLEGAKRAYQRALKLRSLNTDLANYVSSRLVQMNGS